MIGGLEFDLDDRLLRVFGFTRGMCIFGLSELFDFDFVFFLRLGEGFLPWTRTGIFPVLIT